MAPTRRLTGQPGRGGRRPRRPHKLRWALATLLLVPVLELVVIVAVGQWIGLWWTIGLLLAMSALGAWLVRREGSRTWSALRHAVNSGRMPGQELADAALVLVGGVLLLAPGFVSDALGLFLVLPVTRPLSRRWLQAIVGSRILGGVVPAPSGWDPPPGRSPGADVIEGEIIEEPPQERG